MKKPKLTNRELKQQRLLEKETKKQEKILLKKEKSQISRQTYAMTKRKEESKQYADIGVTYKADALNRLYLKGKGNDQNNQV
jgi:hypothetical protein